MKEKIKKYISEMDLDDKRLLMICIIGFMILIITALVNGHIELGIFIAIGLIATGISIIKKSLD